MTLLDQTRGGQLARDTWSDQQDESIQQGGFGQQSRQQDADANVGPAERAVSVAAGALVAIQGLSRRSVPGLICAAVGGALLYRGITGRCPVYNALDIDTAHPADHLADKEDIATNGIHITQAFLINRPADELYRFWRDFQNLPGIMSYVESVQVQDGDGRRSHWVVKAPKILGGKVEWDAEITCDEPNQLIAWRTLGGQVEHTGQIRFSPALGDRGTEVHVYMDYLPPAGQLGHLLISLFGENPRSTIREDLRNFKRVMETGEVLTLVGQPRGSCTGQGKRETA